MRIKTQTDYAISILVYLAEKRIVTSRREMVAALGIGESYMPRITRRLKSKKWITSEPGVEGGYKISADPKEISLLDVMKAMEDSPDIGRNSDRQDIAQSACDVFQDFQSVAYWYFSSLTIDDLMQKRDIRFIGEQLLSQMDDQMPEQEL